MTIEEAIGTLETLYWLVGSKSNKEAITIAIEKLKECKDEKES